MERITSCLLQLLTSRGIKTSSSPALIFVMWTKSGWLITSSETELHRHHHQRLRVSLLSSINCPPDWIQCHFHNGAAGICAGCSCWVWARPQACRLTEDVWGGVSQPGWVAAEAARLQPSSARFTFKPLTLHRLTLTSLTGAHCGLHAGRDVCWYFYFLLIKSSDSASTDHKTISEG